MGLPESHECPRCGAPLPKSSGGTIVCKYCRVNVNLPDNLPPATRHPVRHDTGASGWVKPWLKVETLFAVVIGLGMATWQLQRHWVVPRTPSVEPPEVPLPEPDTSASHVPRHPVSSGPNVQRFDGKPLLVSAGVEHELLVGIATFDDHVETPWLAAWTSEGGRLLWRSPLPAGAHASNMERASLGNAVFLRTAEVIVRLDAASGRRVWEGTAPEPSGRLCATKAYVGVKANEAPTRVLDWETGSSFVVKPGACETLYSSEDAGPNFRYLDASSFKELRKRPKDFALVRGLLPKQGNARVILGTLGAQAAPAVGVVADARWIWQQEVSAYTSAKFPEPPLAAVRRESVVVPFWDVQNGVLRIAAFNLTTGARIWESALSNPTEVRPDAELDVSVTIDGKVVVLFGGGLRAYSLSNGELTWSLGG